MKSAVAAVAGRPSAGKSTLVNALCGGKVSIVSPVPQTTRNRVRGIVNDPRGQIVLVDLPGFHLSEKRLNKRMTELVASSLMDVDAVLYVMDATRAAGAEEEALRGILRAAARPLVACVNKSDIAGEGGTETVAEVGRAFPGVPPILVSALTGEGLAALRDALFALAPEGERLYPEEYYTDQTPEFRVAEIVREKAIQRTREEVPHALYVRLEDMEMRGGALWVRGFICVERESQKGILVGRGGERIKGIVHDAETELSALFPYAVKLDIRVKVDRDWRTRDPLLRKLIH